jgi:hypothetical protein
MPFDLNLNWLHRAAMYGTDDLAALVMEMGTTITDWARLGIITPSDSFGFAAAHPRSELVIPASDGRWNNPYKFVWFVVGWGPDGDRYIANAVRKLRPLLRTSKDTLELRLDTSLNFRNVVQSVVDGKFPWGDFPHGGGTLVRTGSIIIPCAADGFPEVENDFVAKTMGGRIGATMLQTDCPELFAA